MTREEVAKEACSIVALAYHSIGDYTFPSDGFCVRCERVVPDSYFQNSGRTIEYVRQAVLEKLKREGHKIAFGFDPETGKEAVNAV